MPSKFQKIYEMPFSHVCLLMLNPKQDSDKKREECLTSIIKLCQRGRLTGSALDTGQVDKIWDNKEDSVYDTVS